MLCFILCGQQHNNLTTSLIEASAPSARTSWRMWWQALGICRRPMDDWQQRGCVRSCSRACYHAGNIRCERKALWLGSPGHHCNTRRWCVGLSKSNPANRPIIPKPQNRLQSLFTHPANARLRLFTIARARSRVYA